MSAVPQRKGYQPFGLLADTPGKLEQVAELKAVSPSIALEDFLVLAHGELVVGERCANVRFIDRLRELASRPGGGEHPSMEVRTSYALEAYMVNVLRELRDSLQLPRRDLVVEYVIQAAWDVRPDDDGSGDKLARRRRAASHNLQLGRLARPAPPGHVIPLPGQLRLLEEDSTG